MKQIKLITFAILGILYFSPLGAQDNNTDFKPNGSVHFKVFSNFNYSIEDEVSSFQLKRAYFGYSYNFSENFSAKLTYDVGAPDVAIGDSLKGSTSLSQTAFLKVAALKYSYGNLTVNFGMIGLKQHKYQESLWGRRYIYKSFQDETKISNSADLGLLAEYEVNEKIIFDAVIQNGEGYKKIQSNGTLRMGGGFALFPVEGLLVRGYYDYEDAEFPQSSFIHALGYEHEKFTLGAEYNMQTNHAFIENNDIKGFSFYGSYSIKDNLELFARFDQADFIDTYKNAAKYDGDVYIGGIQYAPVKGVKMALNYQSFNSALNGVDPGNTVYVHFEYKF